MHSITAAVGGAFVILALSTSTLATEQGRAQRPVEDSFTTSLDDDFDGAFRPTIDLGYDGYFRSVGHDGIDGHDGGDGCESLFCNNPCPCLYGMVEALFLTREPRLNRQPLVVDQTTNTTLLSNSGFDFNYNPGLRATVGMGLCRGLGMEFSYFGLFEGNDSVTVVRPDPNSFLTFRDNLAGNAFVDMDRVDVKYSSWINSFAVNLPCCCGCCDEIGCGEVCGESGCGEGGCGDPRCQSLTWFSGFRYLNLGEEFNM
jgi:hypothetical protein